MNLAIFKQSAFVIMLTTLVASCSNNAGADEAATDQTENDAAANSTQAAGNANANVSERLTGDATAGKASFAQCSSCHSDQPGDHRTGPSLAGILGTPSGSVEGFSYSPASLESEVAWTEENLDAFLANPRDIIPQTRMVFPGIADPQTRADIVAYLATLE
ncbi:MAG: cytochrome c family protein [Erythrobacter sp.]